MPQGNTLGQEMRQGVFGQKKGIEIGRRDEQPPVLYGGSREPSGEAGRAASSTIACGGSGVPHRCRREIPSVRKCDKACLARKRALKSGGGTSSAVSGMQDNGPLHKQSLKMPLEPLRPTAPANRRTEPVVFDRQPAEYDMGVFVEIAFHLGPDLFGHPIAALVITPKREFVPSY